MARVIETANQLQLKLSVLEKIFALHGDIWVDKSLLIKKVMVEKPWRREVIKGFQDRNLGRYFVTESARGLVNGPT